MNVVSVRYYRTKKPKRTLKGNECAAYFLKTTKQQRATECHFTITELALEKSKACSHLTMSLSFKIKKKKLNAAAELMLPKKKAELYLNSH
jgi:hypothetical protein